MSSRPPTLPRQTLAALRHDVRTPLNHIIGYSEMLLEDLPAEEKAAAELRTIRQNAQQVLTTVQRILLPANGEVHAQDIDRLRAEMEQPLYGIVERLSALTLLVRGALLEDVLRINAAAADLLAFTMGRSLKGSGATAKRPGRAARIVSPLPTGTVLVVDDNEANRDMLARQLERLGHRTETAQDGQEALVKLSHQNFDLVLLDMMMPVMDGLETLESMKSNPTLRDVPVVILSALDELEEAARSIEAGAEDYLIKPSEPSLLRARIGTALERKRLRDAERRRTEELERAESELRQSNEELRRFAYAASHDLQEPLRAVSGHVQMLARCLSDRLSPDEQELVEFALDGTRRMHQLIEDLLAYAAISTSDQQLEPVVCGAVLQDVLQLLRHTIQDSGATVSFDELPTVYADRSQLGQLFSNLLSNAIKYRRADVAPQVRFSAQRQDAHWLFSVQDNGIGIAPEYRERIFQVFRRLHGREVPGTGVGLAICQRVVERLGGRIWVEAAEGQGSIFLFTLPAEPPPNEIA